MKKEKQRTKKQHYVPRFYLKYFSKEKILYVYDKEHHGKTKNRSVTSVAHDEYFYSSQEKNGIYTENDSQRIEQVLSVKEDKQAKEYNKNVELLNGHFKKGEKLRVNVQQFKEQLCDLMAWLFIRTKAHRKELNEIANMYNLHERAIKEEFKANNIPDTKENRLKYYAGILLRFDKKEGNEQEAIANSLFQKFLYCIFTDFIPARSVNKKAAKRVEAEFFRMVRDPGTNQCQIIESVERIYIKLLKKLFKNKKWIICINNTNSPFLTSDVPVVPINNFAGNYIFPITPEILLILATKKEDTAKELFEYGMKPYQVKIFNNLIIKRSMRYSFSKIDFNVREIQTGEKNITNPNRIKRV